MSIAFLSNDDLRPPVNWSTLGPPFRRGIAKTGARVVTPQPGLAGVRFFAGHAKAIRRSDAVFWMQLSGRPEWPTACIAALARRRSAWIADAWPYAIPKIMKAARFMRLDPCFVAFKEAYELIRRDYSNIRVEHMPFGVDVDAFSPIPTQRKDIFAFWMGRRHAPLHNELMRHCEERGLVYLTSQGGRIADSRELGELVARSKYFVVTTPDVDHPERSGGFSPLVMRYLEGLAAGTRLIGTRPLSGELDDLGLTDGLLQVAPDGSDLRQALERDCYGSGSEEITGELCEVVRSRHSWEQRARRIVEILDC